MSSNNQVSGLVSLITNAAETIKTQYMNSSSPGIPSLDDTRPHPFDYGVTSPELKSAVQILEGACAQLCAMLARPDHTILNRCMNVYEMGCLEVVVTFKIPDILQEAPAGMHIIELGKKAGIEPDKIGRILRLLATKHIFREVTPDVFANNRLSVELLSSNPLSNLSLHFTDEAMKWTTMLSDTLGDPEWGHSNSPNHSPFNKWTKHPGTLFDYFEGEGAKNGARFGAGMPAWSKCIDAGAIITGFPWADLGDGASVCDVGGGIGTISMQLAKAHPNLRLKLQDTPDRIAQAQNEVWPRECPEAIKEGRIEFKSLDFLNEKPIEGCDIYYVKNVIHDWPDEAAIKILRGVREAMKPSSRVLIQEFVLQNVGQVENTAFKQAPEPLLPNYGVGRIRQYNIDINMMVVINSRERRFGEFVKLGEQAGLKFVKLWDLGEMSVVEFGLKAGNYPPVIMSKY